MSIRRLIITASLLTTVSIFPSLGLANEAKDCAAALIDEAEVADLFPGLDRTFFRLFRWREVTNPILKKKFEGTPNAPALADILRVSLTRADPQRSPAGAERYQLAILLRTRDRAIQESLARALEAAYEDDENTLSFWGHQVTNEHVLDGDFWISFLEAPFAKNVSMGIGVTKYIYDFLDDGGRLARLPAILAEPRRIAPPVIALAPPPGAKIQ